MGSGITANVNLYGETCDMPICFGKNIRIGSPSPQVEPFLSSNDIYDVFDWNFNYLTLNEVFRADANRRWYSILLTSLRPPHIWKIPILWHFSIKENQADVVRHVPSRGISSVRPYWRETPVRHMAGFVINEANGFERSNGNKRSLACDEGAFGYFSGLSGGISRLRRRIVSSNQKLILADSDSGQDSRKYSYPKCEKCNRVTRRPLPKSFATFTFLVVGFVFFGVLLIFGLIGWLRRVHHY